MKNLLVIGNDKLCGKALTSIARHNISALRIVIDKSAVVTRLARLIAWRAIPISVVLRMILCELSRRGKTPSAYLERIHSNEELLSLIKSWGPHRVVLFRAGLIISRKVIDTGIPIMNIHCAAVPEYGGLGSISRAISDRAFSQYACLHVVTSTIDNGEVLDRGPYLLSKKYSYRKNERIAYDAGARLLIRTIYPAG